MSNLLSWIPGGVLEISPGSMASFFAAIPDPRDPAKCRHKLLDILIIAVLAPPPSRHWPMSAHTPPNLSPPWNLAGWLCDSPGLLPMVMPRTGDMAVPDIPPGSLDLLWSEGAIAHIGWSQGLRTWKDLVRPGGIMAITDATWLEEDPPPEAQRAWEQWYPGMGTEASNLQIARELGLEVISHFRLPRQDWWDYFEQAAMQCQRHRGDESLSETIAAMQDEIDLYRRAGRSYGYAFFILRKV